MSATPPVRSAATPSATPAAAAAESRCPRCGAAFHCGSADAGPCACDTVDLTHDQRARLAARHCGCLCVDCLRAVRDGAPA